MKLSESIKPISFFKAHASEIINDVAENGKTLIVTQNGEAKVIVQDIQEYEKTQESLALLKILAQSRNNLRKAKFKPFRQVFDTLRKKAEKNRAG